MRLGGGVGERLLAEVRLARLALVTRLLLAHLRNVLLGILEIVDLSHEADDGSRPRGGRQGMLQQRAQNASP